MDNNIYGPGDDDYGRNPRLGPSKDNPPQWLQDWVPLIDRPKVTITIPEEVPVAVVEDEEPKVIRPFTFKQERFMEWLAARAYRDIRGKYRIYQMEIKTTLNSIKEVWEWWDEHIENK